jgi:hypothetical protein
VSHAGPPEGFDAKVRFAREVEQCLLQPGMPPAPGLVLKVRERILRAELRRARVRELRRLVAVGVIFLSACGVAMLRFAAPFESWLGLLARTRAAQSALRGAALPLDRPVELLLGQSGVAGVTITALLAVVMLYFIRDLFLDPLRGVTARAPSRRGRAARPTIQ